MENCTWNIIFLAFNIEDKYIENPLTDAINIGIKQFEDNVKECVFSEYVNFNMLKFTSDLNTPKGSFTKYRTVKSEDNKNQIEAIGSVADFNCHSRLDFEKYFRSTVSDELNQKYFVVFLAHSFGSGFFPVVKDSKINEKEYTYLKMEDLDKAFKNTYKKVDCFFALNCIMQSLETNYILRDSVEYLLGSQQPLYTETISYASLFEDLVTQAEFEKDEYLHLLSTQMLFQKFIFDNHKAFILNKAKSLSTLSPFCLTLTKPSTSSLVLYYINLLFKYIYRDDDDTWFHKKLKQIVRKEGDKNEPNLALSVAIEFCEDPSFNDLTNILDANTLFNKLKEIMDGQKHSIISGTIEMLLKYMNNLIIFHLSSGNSYIKVEKKYFNTHFFPMGLGIYIVKNKSDQSKVTLKIFEQLFKNPNKSIFSVDTSKFNLKVFNKTED